MATDVIMWGLMEIVQGAALSVLHKRRLQKQIPEVYLFFKDAPQLYLSSSQPCGLGICINLPHRPDNFTEV